MDKDVLARMVAANDASKAQGKTPHEGVHIKIVKLEEDVVLFTGQIHPNTQYEYEVTTGGMFKLCVELSDLAFTDY